MFWKSISSHTHAFLFLIFNALRYVFKKLGFFVLKSCFFQNFDSFNLIFDQSKSFWKILVSLCLVRLIEPVFRSIEHRESSFFKTVFDSFKPLFQIFFKLSSLSPTWQGSTEDFLSFSTKCLQGFSLTRPIRPLYHFFCFYFHDFMHKLMHFKWIFGTFQIWDFCWINPLFLKLIIGFCWYIVIFMIFVEKFDQFGTLWEIENSRACIEPDLGILFNWVKINEIGLLNWCNWSF